MCLRSKNVHKEVISVDIWYDTIRQFKEYYQNIAFSVKKLKIEHDNM